MALLPLRNALSGLDSLPTSLNLRTDLAVGTPTWNVGQQYFKNDCVLSASNGGMFVFTGTGPDATTIRGGADPFDDSFSATPNWVAFAPPGLTDITSTAVTATLAAAAASAAVVTAGSLSLSPALATPGAVYSVTWQGTWATTGGVAFAATDLINWVFTPDGAGAVVVSSSVAPGGVASPYQMSGNLIVAIPAAGTQIAGSIVVGTAALGVVPLITNLRVTYARIQ